MKILFALSMLFSLTTFAEIMPVTAPVVIKAKLTDHENGSFTLTNPRALIGSRKHLLIAHDNPTLNGLCKVFKGKKLLSYYPTRFLPIIDNARVYLTKEGALGNFDPDSEIFPLKSVTCSK